MEERLNQDYKKYYKILDGIGSGAFGMVYKGIEIETNELRAIKVIQLDKIKESILAYEDEEPEKKLKECIDGFIKECENMKICSNINSVKYYEYFIDENNIIIIMELCDCNLSQLLIKKKGFNDKEIYEIMKQLNNGLKIMKENKIIHRDLKLENILIKYKDNNKYIIKISDYGSSKRLDSLSKNYCNSKVGTLIYMAPEIINGEEYNYKCDLWSIGIIIYRLKFDKFPFSGQTESTLIKNINNFNKIKETGNKELDDLIKKLLEKEKEKRLNWDEYFNHPFFHSFSNKINLIYYRKEGKDLFGNDITNKIFGKKFVENNRNNIELIINGNKSELIEEYKLKDGENNIEIIIKNKITNFEDMFYNCISLKNIEGLKYLDVSNGNNFSSMFYGCSSLSNIKGLENWNVSNGNNFSEMFWMFI